MLGQFIAKGQHRYMEMAEDLKLAIGSTMYRVGVIPLFGARDREVGDIVVHNDVTDQLQIEALEKDHLIEQAAISEERSRLTKDLHDSLTQSLYSVSLFAQTARNLPGKGTKVVITVNN
jgi:signal transduction histidine kinase